jgi:Cu/Ag efflux protein CusF
MKRSATLWLPLAVLASMLLAGCSGEPARKDNGSSAKRYEIKGKVVSVDQRKPAVTLDHEDIPGLMKGMEMEFEVADSKVVEAIKPGDQVKGELVKDKSGYRITKLEKR